MKALVVYDSVYGNTERIANAIAGAIVPSGDVKAVRPGEVSLSELQSVELLIVGSPVQGGRATKAVQTFLKNIPANGLGSISVATFDTRWRCGLPSSLAMRPSASQKTSRKREQTWWPRQRAS